MLDSRIGQELLNLYERIDSKIESHYKNNPKQPPCAKGCASCCSQFFEVSQAEYALIFNHLKAWTSSQLEELRVKSEVSMLLLQTHHPKFFTEFFVQPSPPETWRKYYKSPERYRIHIPCPFLSEAGACTVYEVRPLICRTTGVGYKLNFEWGSICTEMRFAFLAKRWQADLRAFQDEICAYQNMEPNVRLFPLFYYTAHSFSDTGTIKAFSL